MNPIDNTWRDINGWFSEDEAEALQRAFIDVRRSVHERELVVVELGSYKGRSTAILAGLCRDYSGKVHAVNRWVWCRNPTLETVGSFNPNGPKDEQTDYSNDFVQNLNDLRLLRYVSLWKMETSGASAMFPNDAVNLILHDASHDYEPAKADLDAWIPKLRRGGILCMHDYGWNNGQGCGRAVNEQQCLDRLEVVGSLYVGRKTT